MQNAETLVNYHSMTKPRTCGNQTMDMTNINHDSMQHFYWNWVPTSWVNLLVLVLVLKTQSNLTDMTDMIGPIWILNLLSIWYDNNGYDWSLWKGRGKRSFIIFPSCHTIWRGLAPLDKDSPTDLVESLV